MSNFFSAMFDRAAGVVAGAAPAEAAVAPTAPAPVLQSLTIPTNNGENVTVAVTLQTREFTAKALESEGLTYRQIAERVNPGSSDQIGTYTVMGTNGSTVVEASDIFRAELPNVGTVTSVDTTPASTGSLG
jgi:hypothetical protein